MRKSIKKNISLEDRLDVAAANEALADMKVKNQKPIPWEEVKKRLKLK